MVRATAKAETREAAEALLKPLVAQVLETLGDVVNQVLISSRMSWWSSSSRPKVLQMVCLVRSS